MPDVCKMKTTYIGNMLLLHMQRREGSNSYKTQQAATNNPFRTVT